MSTSPRSTLKSQSSRKLQWKMRLCTRPVPYCPSWSDLETLLSRLLPVVRYGPSVLTVIQLTSMLANQNARKCRSYDIQPSGLVIVPTP